MKNFSAKKAGIIAMVLLVGLVVFHVLILTGTLSKDFVWGGRLKSDEQVFVMESFSVVLNLILIVVTGLRLNQFRQNKSRLFVTVLVWLMFLLFILSGVGNFLSESFLEKVIMTPFALIMALLCLRMALWRPHTEEKKIEGGDAEELGASSEAD